MEAIIPHLEEVFLIFCDGLINAQTREAFVKLEIAVSEAPTKPWA